MPLNISKAVNDYFLNNWTATPIQIEGVDFITPTAKKWISISILPYDREAYAYDGDKGRKKQYVLVAIRCYDITPTLSHLLAQEVQSFFECVTLEETLAVGLGIGDGNGAVNLGNAVYQVTLNFDTINYE